MGFKLKVREKGKKPDGSKRYVIEAHVRDKALKKIRARSKEIIGQIRRTYDPKMEYRLIQKYNSYLIGIHNYYCIATHVNLDIHEIAFDVKRAFTTDSNTDCKEQEVFQTGISKKNTGEAAKSDI